jgi:hypothetical protein
MCPETEFGDSETCKDSATCEGLWPLCAFSGEQFGDSETCKDSATCEGLWPLCAFSGEQC